MPCYNEADHIESTLRDWADYLSELVGQYEIIVVNDGSTDGTGRILDRLRRESTSLRVIHQLRAGHEKAVRRGYEVVRGAHILQVDPNGRYDPYDFFAMWEMRESYRLVIGRRTHRIDRLLSRYFSRFVGFLAHFLFKCPLAEPDLPFRLFQKDTLIAYLSQIPQTFESVNMALAILVQRDYPESTAEIAVPFRFRRSRKGRFRMTMFIGFAMHIISELLRLRLSLVRLQIHSPSTQSSHSPA